MIALSSSSLPAPLLSPLTDGYEAEVEQCARALNQLQPDGVQTRRFTAASEAVEIVAEIAVGLELTGAAA